MTMSTQRDLLRLVAFFLALHGGLLIFDYYNPEAFLMGDRSRSRIAMIENFSQALIEAEGIMKILSSQSIIGDYFIHALAYVVGGKEGILVLQVSVTILSICIVYLIALLLSNKRKVAWLSAILYGTLPHTLAFPHLLVTEVFSNTFLILSVYELLKFNREPDASSHHLALAGLWIAISMLIRPIAILLPIFIGIIFFITRRDNRAPIFTHYFAAAYLPMLFWMTIFATSTGQFSTGATGSTLGYNLYLRIERMHASAPEDEPEPLLLSHNEDSKRVSLPEFADYGLHHPAQFFNLLQTDIPNMLLNSGVNKFFGYYLNIYDVGSRKGRRWREIVDRYGLLKAGADIFAYSSTFVLFFIIFTIYWFVLLVGAGLGFKHYISRSNEALATKLILVVIPIYILFFTLIVVSGPRSGHRSPFDFIICIMFAMYVFERGKNRALL